VRAMIRKEFLEMRRDRRTVALMVGLPLMLLIIFGYAARFDVTSIDTVVVGPGAERFAAGLNPVFNAVEVDPSAGVDRARRRLTDSEAPIAFVTGGPVTTMLVDGTQLFVAQSALRRIPPGTAPDILFNPELDTAPVMVPSLIGLILLFVGTVITSLGVVKERESGTLEQLAVMPLRPVDVTIGKIAPYFVVAVVDMAVVTLAGLWIFGVPFVGSPILFGVYSLVFLFVVLGLGVAISTVSRSQGEAIQLAIMALLPQIMLSGMIFPLESMAAGVRWIGYVLPLTWFVAGMRGIFLKGSSVATLAVPLAYLTVMAIVVFGVAVTRFRRELGQRSSPGRAGAVAAEGGGR